MRPKLPLEVGWHGLRFLVLLLKLLLLPLAPAPFGTPSGLLWLWRGKASPHGFLGHRLSKRRCDVVVGVLLFISLLSPCCFLAPSAVPSLPLVPVCASPPRPEGCPAGLCSWCSGGRRRGHPPYQLHPHTGRPPQADATSAGEATCLPISQSRMACCPYSCTKSVRIRPVLPLCPSWEDECARGMLARWWLPPALPRVEAAAGSPEGAFLVSGHVPLEGQNRLCRKWERSWQV